MWPPRYTLAAFCFACMARLPEDRLLYVSPDSGGRERRNLTVRVSNHEGAQEFIVVQLFRHL